jgi:hypothetical protein
MRDGLEEAQRQLERIITLAKFSTELRVDPSMIGTRAVLMDLILEAAEKLKTALDQLIQEGR